MLTTCLEKSALRRLGPVDGRRLYVLHRDGMALYVGQSASIRARLSSHLYECAGNIWSRPPTGTMVTILTRHEALYAFGWAVAHRDDLWLKTGWFDRLEVTLMRAHHATFNERGMRGTLRCPPLAFDVAAIERLAAAGRAIVLPRTCATPTPEIVALADAVRSETSLHTKTIHDVAVWTEQVRRDADAEIERRWRERMASRVAHLTTPEAA